MQRIRLTLLVTVQPLLERLPEGFALAGVSIPCRSRIDTRFTSFLALSELQASA
jgi:hypothetical protein